jgi:hypothetical protein
MSERQALGDPRPSLQERYGDHAGYVNAVVKAVERVQKSGFLLPEDGQRLIQEAQASKVLQ